MTLFQCIPLERYPCELPTVQNKYTTKFLWSGLKCLNPHTKQCFLFSFDNGKIERTEIPYPDHLSRIDHVEDVDVVVYSDGTFTENNIVFKMIK